MVNIVFVTVYVSVTVTLTVLWHSMALLVYYLWYVNPLMPPNNRYAGILVGKLL